MSQRVYCSHVVKGDAKEVKALYELMKELENSHKKIIKNDNEEYYEFMTELGIPIEEEEYTLLEYLVEALGMDTGKMECRGAWSDLSLEDGVLKFETDSPWLPCFEVMECVNQHFPSLRWYFSAISDMGYSFCNERLRYMLSLNAPQDGQVCFENEEELIEWAKTNLHAGISSIEDIYSLSSSRLKEQSDFCFFLFEFDIYE